MSTGLTSGCVSWHQNGSTVDEIVLLPVWADSRYMYTVTRGREISCDLTSSIFDNLGFAK